MYHVSCIVDEYGMDVMSRGGDLLSHACMNNHTQPWNKLVDF